MSCNYRAFIAVFYHLRKPMRGYFLIQCLTKMSDKDPDEEEKSVLGRPFPLKFVILAVLVYIFAYNLYLFFNS